MNYNNNNPNYANLGISQYQLNHLIKSALTMTLVDSLKKSHNPKEKLFEILDDKLASRNTKQIANDLLRTYK